MTTYADTTTEIRPYSPGKDRLRSLREELAARIASALPHDGGIEPLDGVVLRRESAPTPPSYGTSHASVCIVAQGSKELILGKQAFHYDPAHYLITTASLPIISRVVEASPEIPYLAIVLRLDPVMVGSVLMDAGYLPTRKSKSVRAVNVSKLDENLLDAAVRMIRLLDRPEDVDFLLPLIKREIIYRLLQGEQGDRLLQISVMRGHTHEISRAIDKIRSNFHRPLKIEELARELGMSVSGFHHQFKAVTGMSPLQFQKQLRLQEARRLMLVEGLDATSAGYRVGYNDPSHFNRDYRKLFGAPPMRDIERFREVSTYASAV